MQKGMVDIYKCVVNHDKAKPKTCIQLSYIATRKRGKSGHLVVNRDKIGSHLVVNHDSQMTYFRKVK